MSRKCPNCLSEMTVKSVDGFNLSVCPECGGTWFEADELRKILAAKPESIHDLDHLTTEHVSQTKQGQSRMLCPDCEIRLVQYHYMYNSPIILDTCEKCGGFWVASGEIEKMWEWREKSHQPISAKEEAGILLGEAAVAHDKEMAHSSSLSNFFGLLRVNEPGWFGFLP
ncbi:MAG: zf-TFIIB domain-containing protein [Armatimonadetes bacterium]|nr:zf-TFIIB domain-containing protein [Armatimonadota bacterium]